MGSGASSHAKTISSNPAECKEQEPKDQCQSHPQSANKKKECSPSKSKVHSVDINDGGMEDAEEELSEESTFYLRAQQAEKQYKVLEKQMGALEVANLDLQDQVQNLQERLEYAYQREEMEGAGDEGDCTETVKAKNLVIERLEAEITATQEQSRKLRIQCKRRLKALKAKSAEAGQNSSLKVLELNTEISQLQDENSALREKLQASSSTPHSKQGIETEAEDEDPRTKLILDLSAQISQQDARNTELENKLHEKNKEMEEMQRCQSRVSSAGKPRDRDSIWSPENVTKKKKVPTATLR